MEDDGKTTYGVMVDAPEEDSNDNGNQDPPSPDTRVEDMSDDDFDTEIADEIKADVRMFSGCQDKQTSADVHDVTKFGVPNSDGGAGGACTNALLVNNDDEPDSWMSLLKGMRTTLSTKKFKQIPQMATSKKLDIRSPFSLAGGEGGKHRALLIGINYVGDPSAELKGCHNDVAQMKDYIVKHGYPAEEGEDLKIVMDDGEHTAPTRANIIEAIEWLVEGAAPGDSLFMHYSGHGGSVEDTDNNEKDKRDETMIPVDYSVSGHIKDDELLAELVLPLSEGVVLSVVMDCCHSGSILDLPYTFDADEGALQLVDDRGSGVVHKNAKFNMSKIRKARKLNLRGPYMKAIRAKAAAAAAAKAAATKAAAAKAASEKQEQHEEQEQAREPVGGGTAFKVGSKVAAAAAKARASAATKAVSQQQQEQEQPAANGGMADTANDQPPSEGVAPNAAVAPKFKLSIETEVIKSMETGRYIAPEPMAFKSFTSCEAEMEEDGQDDCDLSIFVVTPSSVDEESGREHAAGISMLWVDSESSTGYSMKHLTKGDARFDGKRAVYVEAIKGEGEEPFLVAVFAPEDFKPASVGGSSGVAPESTEFVVWVCDKLAHSRDETLNWTACGSFVGTKVPNPASQTAENADKMTQGHVKRTSATTSTSGERLVIVEALDVKDEARVFYGTSLGNDDLQMSMFPTPRAMRASNQQVSTVQASTLEKDGETFAIAMALPAAIPKETAVAGDSSDTSDDETEIRPCMLYAQSLNDPGFYAGSIDIPGDTRCFMTTPAYGLKTDVYVAGTKKVIWYDDRSWDGSTGKAGVCLNAVDFTSPAKEMRTMIDKQFIRHVFILLESGKLLYTSQDPEEGSKFDEPVDILPNVEAFSCHADSVGNVHVNNINKDGNLMHHMMDQGTSLWMQKEVMVSGGAAREHLMRFTKHRCAPDPFGMGHLGVERVRRVECRNMGNLAKKARENADEAIYETKKHAAEALNAKLSNAERAQEQATEYAAEATKWAGEAKQAAEAVRWTQAAVEAAEAAVKASEEVEMKASQDIGEMKAAQTFGARKASQESQVDIILGVEGPDEEAARAMEAAARAVEAAGVAQQKSEQAKAMKKLHGSDGQLVDLGDFEAGGYLSAEYSRDRFFGPVTKKLWLAAEAKRVGARPGRGSSHLPVRAGHGQSPAWSGRSPGYHGRSPAIAARYRQPAVSTPAHSDVLKAVEAAGQAVETAAQAMERAEQAKEALGEDTGEPERKGGDPDDRNPRDFGSAESSNKGFFDSIANELRELADEAKREAEKEAAQAAHGPPGYTNSGLFGSETMEAGIPTRRPITDTTAECLKEPRWEAVRQEAAKTAMEAARLVKAAQTAAFELQAVEEVEAAEALDSEEDVGEDDIDGDDGAYGLTEYTSRKFGSRIKKATKKIKSGVQNAAKKTKEAAQTAARKAEEAAKQARSFAKREAERIAKDAARKAEAAALKAKREAEKAAKAVDQAAKDIKKAGELVAKEVVDKAQIAAAGAKQAAEGAAKLAEKAVNEVGDVAGDIKDGVEDVADKVKDGVVHAADKVKDVAKDAAEVVGDVTMKMVDVVEEVVEEVWEHTPEGLKKVARKVAKVVKKGVDFVVKIGKVVYHFVETKLEQLVKALDWLWDKIKTGIMKAIEWLASFFKYKEILKTAEILEAGAIYGIDQFIATIPSEEAVKEFFNDLRLMLERKTGLDLDAQDMSTEDTTPDDREVDPKENFIQHHTTCGTFDDAGTPTDTKDDSKDKGKSSEDSDDDDPGMDTVAQKLNFLYEKLKEGLNAFMSALAEGIVDLLEGGTQLMVKILKFVAKKFRDWLADGGPIYIPVISEIYKLITGRKLKLAKALFFIFAIPVTYMTKAILGRWPSQVVSVDQLTGAKDSTLSIACQEPNSTDADAPAHLTRSLPGDDSSSEFVYTSRSGESEEKPGTDFQKSIWAVLKIASIAMSGVTIPCQAMVTITKIPAGDRKFLTKRFAKSHPILKIISYGRAIQKILNLASTMVYVGDYFTGPKTPLKRKDKAFFSFLTMFDAAGVLISLNVDGGQASEPGAGGLANMDTTGGGQAPKNATVPAIIFDMADGVAEIARGSRLIALAKELDEGGRQERTMKFQGSHGIFKGASQIATAFGKQIVKSAADPFTKVTVVIVAASLKWITKVPLGIASVVLQLEGSAEGNDDDEDLKNNAYWIACFAYL
ncbi:unnamed protein product [Ectocarpus sp. CCAP 1310/34]|nr:unnamed protein product [Ectocarpus sp. CCAP 1310/34]